MRVKSCGKEMNIKYNSMKKYFLLIPLIIIFMNCSGEKRDHNSNLDYFVNESYNYYFRCNNGSRRQEDYKRVNEFRELATKTTQDKNLMNEFEALSFSLLEEYSNVEFKDKKLISSLQGSDGEKIKTLEFIVINTIIKWLHQSYIQMDHFDIIISPKNPIIEHNSEFETNVFAAFNNSYNRIAIVVNGDTLREGPGAAIVYKYPTKKRGIFKTDAQLIITHMGEKIAFPFVLDYEVR
jgi:hypothetical protein